ncbi:GNAT family N-acetyltransferase [Peribacillus sp. SCS-155]|uniref:GNAT family N-acetyltransferase n=1 Tax=Peribacillus sedimenti TaxID=3115297 RepID=UPI00390622C5
MNQLTYGSSRTYYAEVNGDMVSTASTQKERSATVILAGVATPSQFRGDGYASQVIEALCNHVIREGKTLYLFYNNPAACVIYKNIGFIELGQWTVVEFE